MVRTIWLHYNILILDVPLDKKANHVINYFRRHVRDINVTRDKTLPDFIMSSLLLSKTNIGLKLFFAHNVKYGNSVTFRIGMALESLQNLDNHEPQRFDCCIECKPTD